MFIPSHRSNGHIITLTLYFLRSVTTAKTSRRLGAEVGCVLLERARDYSAIGEKYRKRPVATVLTPLAPVRTGGGRGVHTGFPWEPRPVNTRVIRTVSRLIVRSHRPRRLRATPSPCVYFTFGCETLFARCGRLDRVRLSPAASGPRHHPAHGWIREQILYYHT